MDNGHFQERVLSELSGIKDDIAKLENGFSDVKNDISFIQGKIVGKGENNKEKKERIAICIGAFALGVSMAGIVARLFFLS